MQLHQNRKLTVPSISQGHFSRWNQPPIDGNQIGMKAMVLLNVLATEADIANGTQGEIQDIILNEREESSAPDKEGIIQLKYPSAMILFKPDRRTRLTFAGLPPESYH